jgi:hypothetical protein
VVAQDGLHSRNVGDLQRAAAVMIAGRQTRQKEEGDRQQELVEDVFHGVSIQYNASPFSATRIRVLPVHHYRKS